MMKETTTHRYLIQNRTWRAFCTISPLLSFCATTFNAWERYSSTGTLPTLQALALFIGAPGALLLALFAQAKVTTKPKL